MFRRPDDDDDDYSSRKVVKAKPIAEKYAKALGMKGKDFVQGGEKSQNEFYGQQTVERGDSSKSSGGPLTEDERNKISAKILKAEMKGDTDLVNKLKRKLEGGGEGEEAPKAKQVVLMKKDRSGNLIPASSRDMSTDRHAQGSSRMQREYGKQQDLDAMVREEKTGTAADQLRLFERSLVKSAKIKRHDDESVDDIAEMQKGRKKADEKDEKKHTDRMKREHRKLEHTLDDCARCIESRKLSTQCVIAVGISTYLAVVEWDGLDEEHLLIVPTSHAASTIQLDENVWDEMRLWRKGLVALWKKNDMDCVFFETAHNVSGNSHCFVECVPIPMEVGESAPIYFHKAINECESEWADNKKLIEIKDLRRQIPRGFNYFAIDFGLQNGYAHVIEDQNAFPANFAHEIIAGMLDLSHKKWRKREKMEFTDQKKKCDDMKVKWEPFDWTKRINRDTNQ